MTQIELLWLGALAIYLVSTGRAQKLLELKITKREDVPEPQPVPTPEPGDPGNPPPSEPAPKPKPPPVPQPG